MPAQDDNDVGRDSPRQQSVVSRTAAPFFNADFHLKISSVHIDAVLPTVQNIVT